MGLRKLWREHIFSPSNSTLNALDRHRAFLIRAIILSCLSAFLFFAFFNTFVTGYYLLAGVDMIGFFLVLISLWLLESRKNIFVASTIVIFIIFSILVSVLIIDKTQQITIVFMLFLPLVAIFLKGIHWGLLYTFVFSLLLVGLMHLDAFSYISDGLDVVSITHFLVVLLGITFLSVFYELSRLDALKNLKTAYEKEHEQNIKLAESQKQFQIIFENLSCGFLIINCKSRACTYANLALQEMMGIEVSTDAKNELIEYPPLVLKTLTALLLEHIDRNETLLLDQLVVREDNSTFFANIDFSKEYSSNCSLYVACFIHDVTNSHEMACLLSESHDRYQALFNQLPEAAWIIDAITTRFLDLNDEAVRQYGYTKEEFLELHISDIDINEEYDDVVARSKRGQKEKAMIFEAKHRRKDGSVMDALVSIRWVKLANYDILSVTCLDITQQKKQEKEIVSINQRYIQLFENIPQAAWVADPFSHRFLSVNKAFIETYGYSKEDVANMVLEDIHIHFTKEMIVAHINQVLDEQGIETETVHKRKDGTMINVIVNTRRVNFDNQINLVSIVTNITHLKFLQGELQELTFSLQERIADEVQKNRQKDLIMHDQAKSAQMGEMLRMIAHQWRQPINAISASSIELSLKSIVDGAVKNEDVQNHCLFIEEQTQRMSKTIDDFMNFFKPRQTKNSFTLQEVLKDIDSLMGMLIKNRDITLECITCEETPLYSYQKELTHVLINLFSNAADAFLERDLADRHIWVHAICREEFIYISVMDNAGGIPMEILGQIFDPYFTTKEPGKGTGIGLYMTRRIIEEILHGTVSAANIDNGALFMVIIPYKEEVH